MKNWLPFVLGPALAMLCANDCRERSFTRAKAIPPLSHRERVHACASVCACMSAWASNAYQQKRLIVLDVERLVVELLAIDGLAPRAVEIGEVTALPVARFAITHVFMVAVRTPARAEGEDKTSSRSQAHITHITHVDQGGGFLYTFAWWVVVPGS